MLARADFGDSLGKRMQVVFGGLNHTPACADGELWNTENVTTDFYPVLASRKPRGLYKTLAKCNGFGARDKLFWVDGTDFYYDGVRKGSVADSGKAFAFLGAYILIWPDKAYYNSATDVFGKLEETYVSGAGQISFSDGTYAGVPAKANTITTTGTAFAFEVGDAVTISGCSVSANNTTPIIREISDDKKTLRFTEKAFTISSGTSYTESGAVTIKRAVPDMDFIFVHENRVWGGKDDSIRCSALGNPKVWNDLDGTATGCWAVDVGSAGSFTGGVSYLGYAIFMKEERIYKVYGGKPSNFKALDSARSGVKDGCGGSFAIAGETLFYVGRNGVLRYTGGYPYEVGAQLGELLPLNAAGGSDGDKYYLSGTDAEGKSELLVYDTRCKLWTREDGRAATDFCWYDDALWFRSGNELWCEERKTGQTSEGIIASFVEFGDFREGSPDKKVCVAFQILSEGTVTVKFQKDGGAWETIGTVTGTNKQMHRLPIVNRRCDFWRLRLEGSGDWKVYEIAREFELGSDMN